MPHVKYGAFRSSDDTGIWLECNDDISCRVQVVTPYVLRVLFRKASGLRQERTWAIVPPGATESQIPTSAAVSSAPGCRVNDTPTEGWDRLAMPFAKIPFSLTHDEKRITLGTTAVKLVINLEHFGFQWFSSDNGEVALCQDRPSRPYHFNVRNYSFSHSMARREGDIFLGLGDRTGRLNLHGRRLRLAMKDALGYDPEHGDPLYKHWPFLLVRDAETKLAYGILYDNMAEGSMDLGCEHSNYYGLYRTYEAVDGDLDMYFILGPQVKDVVFRMVQLIGGTALMPRWSLGFHCTAMPLADAPNAQQCMEQFITDSVKSSVPCSAFHFGSGYTSIGKRRYVFHWNKEKFPDPQGLIASFKKAGMRVVANVKPCLLVDHPSYGQLKAVGGFVSAASSGMEPAVSQFWDGDGAHVDFTNPAAVTWWKENLQKSLLDLGVSTAWNDNNEYEITEEFATSNNFGSQPLPLSISRPLHSLLMTRASFEQQLLSSPEERPYSVTRAGFFGIQRYAQTWTGDNSTGWRSLKWNLRMGLALGLSGLFNIGHDVGGFSGPAPEPELLVRWVQAGLLHPRFIMNSWKADGTVTTPWMHPSVLPMTRWAIRLRYRLIPYLYSLLISASLSHVPYLRPTFLEFPEDERCWEECNEMLLGSSLLAAPVVEEGARQRTLYLPQDPQGHGWFDFFSEEFYPAGQVVTVAAPLASIPLFARSGAIAPMTRSVEGKDFTRLHDDPSRIVRLFPHPTATSTSSAMFFEDDGVTLGGPRTTVHVLMHATAESVAVTVTVDGSAPLPYDVLGVSVPVADKRPLALEIAGADTALKLEKMPFGWHSFTEP